MGLVVLWEWKQKRLAFPVVPILILTAATGVSAFFRRWWLQVLGEWRRPYCFPSTLSLPGDVILAAYDWQDGYIASYPSELNAEIDRNEYVNYDPAPLLDRVFSKPNRVWVMNYQVDVLEPGEPMGHWMSQHAGLTYAEWFGRSQIALFVRPEEGEKQPYPTRPSLPVRYCS